MPHPEWPDIPYADWAESCDALHLYTQIVGKYVIARAPWLNHSWHATLKVTPTGLATGLVPDAGGLEIRFDLRDHAVRLDRFDGGNAAFPLAQPSVAAFHAAFLEALASLGGDGRFDRLPNELPDPVRFDEDDRPRSYDSAAVSRFHRALLSSALVLERFRTGFLGKCSPVHFFWGSFDLAVTRFSGERAPLHPGGIPHLPDPVTREAYSHQVSSAGFWPGKGLGEAAFYSYAWPQPPGFGDAPIAPEAAYFHKDLGEFLLPYAAVAASSDPAATLLRFLETSYAAAADGLAWDRAALECHLGQPGRPRAL